MAYEEIVTSSRKINGKALDADIALTAEDVGAANKAYVDAVKRPYLVNFTKGSSSTSYTADKTLQEIYDAVQAGHQVYGYINTSGYWAYIPLSSCFTQNSNIFVYFEGPLASGNGSMVARNKVIRYISLTGLNNDDATSKQYKFVAYNAVSSDIAINKKALNTGDITLTPSDIGSSLKITFTLDETTGFYNSNKTLNDIYLARNNGSIVYGEFNNEIYELTKCYKSGSNYRVIFTLIKTSGVMPQTTETKFENYGTESQDVSFKQTINYLPILNQASIDNNTSGGYVYMMSSGGSMIKNPTADDIGAQSKITANGFLKSDGNGNITAEEPVYIVNFSGSGNTRTSDKTAKQIYDAYSANYSIIGKDSNYIYSLITCKKYSNNKYDMVFTVEWLPQGPIAVQQNFPRILALIYKLSADDNTTAFYWGKCEQVPSTRKINGKALSSDITLTAADVGAASLTGNQTISGDRTINSNISLAANNDNSNTLTVGIPTIFKNNVNFKNATVTGLTTAAVGTTTDYSIYIGSTTPAANTAPLIWIDTSSSGVMKYRTSTSSTTWTAVPVAWG